MAETKRTDLSAKLHVAGMSATILAMGTGFATEAEAMRIITGPGLNVNIANSTFPLDLDGDGNPDFGLANYQSVDPTYPLVLSVAFAYGNNAIEGINIGPGGEAYSSIYNKAYANNLGETVGPINLFVPKFATLLANVTIQNGTPENVTTANGTTAYGYWPEGAQRFLGLQFEIPPENGDGPTTHYGFAGLTLAEGTLAMNLDCYGYESVPDTAIEKSCGRSTVPEPASLLLLAAGAVPLLALRRRRARH